MPARFGYYNTDQPWSPDYGDIDWGMLVHELEGREELEAYEPVGFDSDDGLVQEIHQDTATLRTSEVAPYMDMMAVRDPRDEKDYIWFREDNPENFEDLCRSIGRAVLHLHSRFPLPDTVAIYLDRRTTGIDPEYLEQPNE